MARRSTLYPVPFTVAANSESQPIAANGLNVFCVSASAACSIAFDEESEFKYLDAGIAIESAPGDEPFKKIRIKNPTGGTITGVLLVGTGRVSDYRKSVTLDATTLAALLITQTALPLGPTNNAAIVAQGALGSFLHFSIYVVSGVVTINGTAALVGGTYDYPGHGRSLPNPAWDASAGQITWLGTQPT